MLKLKIWKILTAKYHQKFDNSCRKRVFNIRGSIGYGVILIRKSLHTAQDEMCNNCMYINAQQWCTITNIG